MLELLEVLVGPMPPSETVVAVKLLLGRAGASEVRVVARRVG